MNARIEDAAWDFFIMFACVFLLGAILFGCSGLNPPDAISIDPDFSADQRIAIMSAADAWCQAVGWCPAERAWIQFPIQEGAIRKVEGEALHARKGGQRGGHNDGWSVVIDSWLAEQPTLLWIAVAHELGHYCIEHHTRHGIMAGIQDDSRPLEIDEEAVRAWHDGCD